METITFAAGLPGFPDARRFRLEALSPNLAPFTKLRTVEGPDVAFTVIEPARLFSDYTIEIDEEHRRALGIETSADVLILVLVTVPKPPAPPTVNLLGPVVINRRTGAAAQVVQHRSNYRVAMPITPTV